MRSCVDRRRRRGEAGFSLLEVFVAAFLLIIVFFGLAQTYMRGRVQIGYEEDRRKATAVAQWRLDGIRRDFAFDDLASLDGTTLTTQVDNRNYTIVHAITSGPESHAMTVELTITWQADVGGSDVSRSLVATTILGRGLPFGGT
jgi:Tfp pilus assembly protein PilV